MTTPCPICGYVSAKIGSRSWQQHKLFFGLVALVWNATSDSDDRPFPSQKRLRYWLTVKAGYYTEVKVPPAYLAEPIIAVLKDEAPHLFFVPHRGRIRVLKAKSIKWHKMGGDEFTKLMNKVIDVVAVEVLPGLPKSAIRTEIAEIAGVNWSMAA